MTLTKFPIPDESDALVIVKAASQLAVIDSTKVYLIDGVIDMGTQEIEVPSGGLNLLGHTFDVSKLISSENNYTMFTSPVGGSGDVLGMDYAIEVTGTGSQVYDITADAGTEAFEFSRINYNGCTSLGEITGYRQGLETGTGRFGGTPTITLSGTWAGGYFIDTSIVRGLDAAMNAPLYAAGTAFTMASRFRSNQNIDLGATAEFFDFAPTNFPNDNTVQIDGAIVSRGSVFDPDDATIIPNMSKGDVQAFWTDNIGISNTFVGGSQSVSSETTTTISVMGDWETLAGTWATSDLQHFDSPSSGQLRHIATSPVDFGLISDLTIEGTANDSIAVRVRKWDDSASSFVTVGSQARQVNSLVGSRNVAFFTIIFNIEMHENDYVFLEVQNNTGTADLTAELDSFVLINTR